jgi:hypothetical protein
LFIYRINRKSSPPESGNGIALGASRAGMLSETEKDIAITEISGIFKITDQ